MKKGFYNILFAMIGQALILVLGILVPRFVLHSYGDEANGLINAISQVFTYLALIEAGVGQASLQSLYGPVVRGEYDKTNGILSATQGMFRRLTVIYIVFVCFIALFYPIFIDVKDSESILFLGSTYFAVFLIVLLQGIANAISFYYVSTLKQILIADGRNYIIVNITTIIKIITSVLRIILINSQVSLVLLQLVYIVMNALEVFFYKFIVSKKYRWINLNSKPNNEALWQKNSFVVHEICNVVFGSTDILILSIFCDLEIASIYAIYNLVFSALNQLISQMHSGCYYILGQTYSQNKEKYIKVHDAYDSYYMSFVFALISTAYIMILPFVKLYTSDVSSINYIDNYLPLLFCSIQILSCCRITSSNLIKLAGHARLTVWRAITEAAINFLISVALVNFIGIYGVLLGTIIALLYRTNDMIIYANRQILMRSPLKTYKTVAANFFIFTTVIVVNKEYLSLPALNSFPSFFAYSFCTCIVMIAVYFTLNSIVNQEAFKLVIGVMRRTLYKR